MQFPPIVLHVCSLITRLVDFQEVCSANSTGPCLNFVGPPNVYTSLFGVLVHFGLLGFYSVDTSFESLLVCPSILSLLHIRILAKRADWRVYVCLSCRVSTLVSWAPTARVLREI